MRVRPPADRDTGSSREGAGSWVVGGAVMEPEEARKRGGHSLQLRERGPRGGGCTEASVGRGKGRKGIKAEARGKVRGRSTGWEDRPTRRDITRGVRGERSSRLERQHNSGKAAGIGGREGGGNPRDRGRS